MTRFLIKILSNSIAIFLADYFVSGITFRGDVISLLIASLVLGFINFFVKPVLKLVAAPFILLTLGLTYILFTIGINMFVLWILDRLIPELTINGFSAYFWGVVIISAVNIITGGHKS